MPKRSGINYSREYLKKNKDFLLEQGLSENQCVHVETYLYKKIAKSSFLFGFVAVIFVTLAFAWRELLNIFIVYMDYFSGR